MNLSFMQNEIVLALGWTLIHSLWQGLLLAVITGILLVATRKSDARKRYEMLTALFFLFLLVSGITFARELYLALYHPAIAFSAHLPVTRPVINTFIPLNDTVIVLNKSWAARFKTYFSEHAYLIVTGWFIIFIARFIKLVAELAYVQRLKHYRTHEPALEWKAKMGELMKKLSINRYVQLLESGIVKVPVVMGIFKPVILLPLGLLSQLPADEIEAILLHELAHIRRSDYFVNLCQSLAETVFFFNPALWWLSSLIREERENCCDDIAISVTNNKTKFIDALISFQEFDLAGPSYAVGFPGSKNHLLNRVKRIISKKNKTLNATEKSILTLGMALLIMCSFVAAKKIPLSKIRNKIAAISSNTIHKSNENSLEHPSFLSTREKVETINSFSLLSGYQTSIQELSNITPLTGEMHMSAQEKNDSTLFKGSSISVPFDDKKLTVHINATNWQGTEFRLTKTNDVFVEFTVDNVVIDRPHQPNYRQIIEALETLYHNKRESIILTVERNRFFHHETDLYQQKIDEFDERISFGDKGKRLDNGTRQFIVRKMIDGKWRMVYDGLEDSLALLISMKNKQLERKLFLLDSLEREDIFKELELNKKSSSKNQQPVEFAYAGNKWTETGTNKIDMNRPIPTGTVSKWLTSISTLEVHKTLPINGTWQIKNIEDYPNNSIKIYSLKGGDPVKILENYRNDWNGSDEKGVKLPTAEYYFIIILDKNDRSSSFMKGLLTIESGK